MRQRRHCARERAVLQALVAASAASTAGVRAQGTHDGRPCAEALQSMSTELNGACCSPVSNCVGGFPIQCSAGCSALWTPLARDCRDFLEAQGLEDLGRACLHARKDSSATDVMSCPSGYLQHGDNCYLFSLCAANGPARGGGQGAGVGQASPAGDD